MTAATGQVLGTRALNRALLARQWLLDRQQRGVLETIEHLVGMQAQAPQQPYIALWSRLAPFDPDELSQALLTRRAVRAPLMRATVHLVSARDCLTLRPLMQPVLARTLAGTAYARNVRGVDVDALLAAGRELVEAHPRTRAELSATLAERWPDRDAGSLGQTVTYLLPMVQVTPRGMWGASRQATWTTMDRWLGRPLDAAPSVDEIVLRYLAAFGPATVKDIQTWCGLTRLRDVVERLRPHLRTFRSDQGRELYDLPDAPRPDPETPAPIRFLPEYDNVLLSHADRRRMIAREDHRLFPADNVSRGTVLVDGFVSATWRVLRDRGAATLLVTPLARLTRRDLDSVAEDGSHLLAFVEPDAARRDVQLAPPVA